MDPTGKTRKLCAPAAAASAAVVAMVFGNVDILREILVRLGFPTCLVRAAAVSRDWYKAASDPDFLRRFRALHPPRLLGMYDDEHLRFVPRPHPPELASLVRRCSSFHLDRDVSCVFDCRDGRLLVIASENSDESENNEESYGYAVCSSLHPERGLTAIPWPRFPDDETDDEDDDDDADNLDEFSISLYSVLDRGLLLPEVGGDAVSCTSVTLLYGGIGIWAHVSDFEAGAWNEGRRSELIRSRDWPEHFVSSRKFGVLAHGQVYRTCMEHHILVLDLPSTSLSFLKLPEGVRYDVEEANIGLARADEGSGIFLIHVKGLQLSVWNHVDVVDCIGVGNWKLVDTICLRQAFGDLAHPTWLSGDFAFYVYDVGDNAEFVFLETDDQIFYLHVPSRTVEKVYDDEEQKNKCPFDAVPMMMVWPPSFPLLGN